MQFQVWNTGIILIVCLYNKIIVGVAHKQPLTQYNDTPKVTCILIADCAAYGCINEAE